MRRFTLIQLVLAIVLFAGLLGAYGYWYMIVGKESAEAAGLIEEIHAKTQDSARVAAAKEALESLSADEASVRGYLVRPDDVVPFLGGIEATGAALGSHIEVVSVSAEPGTSRGRIMLSLKITGSFDAVLRTLGAIEYGPYDSSVVNVTFDKPRGDGTETAEWTAAATFALGTQATHTATKP